MELIKQIRDNTPLRESFFVLAEDVFDLSFRTWYQNGCWTERYIPYAMVDGNRVIANVSANIMDTLLCGKPKRLIQIGTVMTHPAYRRQGLSRALIEELLADWDEKVDGFYLYANETVREYYPRFGFIPEAEYQYSGAVTAQNGDFEKLDMENPVHREQLLQYYRSGNPFSALPSLQNEGLLLFYCLGFMRNTVWYSRRLDAICIAEWEGDVLYCHDIFGTVKSGIDTVLSALAHPDSKKAVLGFTPSIDWGSAKKITCDDYLFIWQNGENPFRNAKVRMPLLSHA